jgi:Flp pilus assembly protein TadD
VQGIAEPAKHAGFALVDVLSANPETAWEAKALFAELNVKYPGAPGVEESLGYPALRAGAEQEAALHLARAENSNGENPEVLFGLAYLKLQQNGPTDEVFNLLHRVLALDHTNYNALLELGCLAAKSGNYERAVGFLEKIVHPKPEHLYVVSYTLAYSLIELRQGDRARPYVQRATQAAGNAQDHADVAGLAHYMDQQSLLGEPGRSQVARP